MDLDKIVENLKYHTSIEKKETNLENLLNKTGWLSEASFLSPRQQDMKKIYLDKTTYHTTIYSKSFMDKIKELELN